MPAWENAPPVSAPAAQPAWASAPPVATPAPAWSAAPPVQQPAVENITPQSEAIASASKADIAEHEQIQHRRLPTEERVQVTQAHRDLITGQQTRHTDTPQEIAQKTAATNSAAQNFSGAYGQSIGQMLPHLVGTVAPETGAAWAQAVRDSAPTDPNAVASTAGGVAGGVVKAVPAMMFPVGSIPAYAAEAAGGKRAEIADRRAHGEQISGGREAASAAGSAAIAAGMQYGGAQVAHGIGGGVAEAVAQRALKPAAVAVAKGLGLDAALGFTGQVAQNVNDKLTTDPNRGVLDGAGRAAGLSVAQGTILGAGAGLAKVAADAPQRQIGRDEAQLDRLEPQLTDAARANRPAWEAAPPVQSEGQRPAWAEAPPVEASATESPAPEPTPQDVLERFQRQSPAFSEAMQGRAQDRQRAQEQKQYRQEDADAEARIGRGDDLRQRFAPENVPASAPEPRQALAEEVQRDRTPDGSRPIMGGGGVIAQTKSGRFVALDEGGQPFGEAHANPEAALAAWKNRPDEPQSAPIPKRIERPTENPVPAPEPAEGGDATAGIAPQPQNRENGVTAPPIAAEGGGSNEVGGVSGKEAEAGNVQSDDNPLPAAKPLTKAQQRQQLIATLRDQVMEHFGTEASTLSSKHPTAIRVGRGELPPGAMVNANTAMDLARTLPEDNPARQTLGQIDVMMGRKVQSPPVTAPAGAGRTPPPEQTPQRPGGKEEANAIRKYGLTTVPESAAFVTSDGRLIDSSGKKQGSSSEGRNIDHRQIAVDSLPKEDTTKGIDGSKALRLYMDRTGNARISVNDDEINVDVAKPLSPEQFAAVSRLAKGKTINADITDVNGNVVKSGSFNRLSDYRAFLDKSFKQSAPATSGGTVSERNRGSAGVLSPERMVYAAGDKLKEMQPVQRSREAIQAAKDAFDLNPVPKLARAGVGDEAVEHAAATTSVPHQVNYLLSKVFPDQYHDPEAMSRTMGALVKDNVLAGYDDFQAKATKAQAEGDDAAAQKYTAAADAIASKHDLTQFDKDVQAAKADPTIGPNIERWKEHVNPYLDQLYNEMKGQDPATPREGRGRHTGARLNLLAVNEDGTPLNAAGQPVETGKRPPNLSVTGSTRNPNVRRDRFDRAATFTGNYSTDPQAVLHEVLGRRWNEVTKARLYAALQEKGVAVIPEEGQAAPQQIGGERAIPQGIKLPETDPVSGKTRMVEKTMYVQASKFRELRGVLNTDLRASEHPVAKALTAIQLASPVDAITHAKNILSVASNAQGAGSAWKDVVRKMPILKSLDAGVRIGKVWSEVHNDTPEIRAEIARMSQQGLIRPEFPPSGLQKLTGIPHMLHQADTAARIVMNRFFDNLVERELVKPTETNRRNYINQVGQYNRRLMGDWTRRMKDMGLSPFITAGRNFNRQGRRALMGDPGVQAANPKAAAQLRATQLLGPALTVTIPMMLNMLSTGKVAGRPGTPVGAWDTGRDDENGRPKIWDLMHLSGERRGLRSTGLNAVATGLMEGKDANTIAGNAVDDATQAALHPWLGPGLGFTASALTGRRLDLRGTMQAKTIEGGGAAQKVENARAALESQNAMIYSFLRPALKKAGIDNEPESGGFKEGLTEGPVKAALSAVGYKSAQPPSSAALDLAYSLSGGRFNEGMTNDEAKSLADKQEVSRSLRAAPSPPAKMNVLRQAVAQQKITPQQAKLLLQKQSTPPLQWSIRHLSAEQTMRVWDKATTEERQQIVHDVFRRVAGSTELTPPEKVQAVQKMRRDLSR